ncbi:MAG: hypothetical protein OXH02_13100 [Gemmatimonadetes bacterium]|nr:hypothetical protein [Gemmatimonadota bacterium]
MLKQILTYGVLFSALIAGCSEDVVGPGKVARPLVGDYDLESRTVNSTIQTDSGSTEERIVLVPPQVRGRLRLSTDGRYGQVDTISVSDSTTVNIQNGRWSVLDNVFYFVTDNQQYEDRFTFDGLRLIRNSEEIRHVSGTLLKVTDVWLKLPVAEPPADP